MISNAEFTDYTLVPLIAWALIKDEDDQDGIVGINLWDARDGQVGSAEDDKYFITYVAPGQTPIKGAELAAEFEFTREYVEGQRDEDDNKDIDKCEDEE